MIGEGLRARSDALGNVDLIGVDVAQRGDIDIAGLDEITHIAAAALAATDQAELDSIVRSVDARIRKRRRCRYSTEKRSAGNVVFRHTKIIRARRTANIRAGARFP